MCDTKRRLADAASLRFIGGKLPTDSHVHTFEKVTLRYRNARPIWQCMARWAANLRLIFAQSAKLRFALKLYHFSCASVRALSLRQSLLYKVANLQFVSQYERW
jgi:hypothetical protein